MSTSKYLNPRNTSGEKLVVYEALQEIHTQIDPNIPEGDLRFAVFAQAVFDIRHKTHCFTAKRYLNGELSDLEDIGINPEWAQRVLKKSGVLFEWTLSDTEKLCDALAKRSNKNIKRTTLTKIKRRISIVENTLELIHDRDQRLQAYSWLNQLQQQYMELKYPQRVG